MAADYPSEFDSLLDNVFIFKVEITKGNIEQNWQSYAVKRMSDDEDLIEQYKSLHMIKDFVCIKFF